jgi:hypothetical protein
MLPTTNVSVRPCSLKVKQLLGTLCVPTALLREPREVISVGDGVLNEVRVEPSFSLLLFICNIVFIGDAFERERAEERRGEEGI